MAKEVMNWLFVMSFGDLEGFAIIVNAPKYANGWMGGERPYDHEHLLLVHLFF